ncbi:hypothetical protein LIER_34026 [Lithospermum erythrorhizon]|uniref:Transposon Ty3-I Gag-Pol polyprotein n=1 Tax=Lithospermum erythrorhizon TaxID=34254 RepID=A0AAV3RYH2_LITER
MPGVDLAVALHRLYVDRTTNPSSRRRGLFRRERGGHPGGGGQVAGGRCHPGVTVPTWLANVVLVPKPNVTWRMCTDFTNKNRACPKDYYPLPNIDWLVDSSAGYKVVDFLDAFRGYHQIFLA